MAVEVLDFFRHDEDDEVREPVATLVDYELQDGASLAFRELWKRRPRELNAHAGGPGPDGEDCVLYIFPVTLEDDPIAYTSALNEWLLPFGYAIQGRPESVASETNHGEAMSDLIGHLRSFNRKERFILLTEVLGTDILGKDFRHRLGGCIGMAVPADAYVAMDYHLDWLQMALYLADSRTPPTRIPNDDLVAGNQEDADLLVAFDGESTTHLVLIEAKVETGWTNKQLKSKAERLGRIFGEGRPGAHLATPHYVLASPEPPSPAVSTADWPGWMTRNGDPAWMELRRPSGLRKVTRCDDNGRPSASGQFLRIDP